METTIMGYINGDILGIMEKKMETTIKVGGVVLKTTCISEASSESWDFSKKAAQCTLGVRLA